MPPLSCLVSYQVCSDSQEKYETVNILIGEVESDTKEHLRSYLSPKAVITKPLDLDTTTFLFLDYIQKGGQWKLLEQSGSNNDLSDVVIAHAKAHAEMQYDSPLKSNNMDNIMEPSSVIFDHENQNPDEELEALKVEDGWKVSTEDLEEMQPELSSELEHVANVISQAEGHEEELVSFIKTIHAEHVVHVISAAVHGTSYLRRVLPVGVTVGCSLAALRKFLMYMPKKVKTKAKS
ncbi:hypothetical protein CQW23_01318 [Capsicum baccatum]|uniref:Uncharacterized protein n=1 Tax=Capsicum baccatum TaxID=33114 RepID=A0A2G2XN86_CAPBA|nr:hypothetical protein CQW23_01318 [Capsicum baccatum]